MNDEKLFKFSKDQLVSMLNGTIELYLEYRIASSKQPSIDAAIVEVLQGLKADKELAALGVVPRTLQE